KSSPPSRWSSVLLPEPEAPVMAMVSPAATSSETPVRTSTTVAPSSKRRARSRHATTGSLMAQPRRWLRTRRQPGRIERRRHGEETVQRGGDYEIRQERIGRVGADVIDVRRENLVSQRVLGVSDDGGDIGCQDIAECETADDAGAP